MSFQNFTKGGGMNKKVLNTILNLDLIIAGIALTALILFTFSGVIMRYLVNRPITWGEEFQLFCIVVIVFLGAGAGFKMGTHVAIDIIVERFPEKARKIVEIIICVFSIIVLIYFTVQSSSLAAQMFRTNRISNILHIPYFLIYGTFPAGCLLMIGSYILSVYRRLSGGEENK
jgi:TRAP-type C4-dicarboxylate transport system permease small subunit